MGYTAVIQARMGSTRLPEKILSDIHGRTMLEHVIDRARSAEHIDRVIVATSVRNENDPVRTFCSDRDLLCFSGPEKDVLERYRQAAEQFDLADVVRITADCPLLDPAVTDRVLRRYNRGDADYVSNINPPTFPDGLDVEIFARDLLEIMSNETRRPEDREHVTLYVRRHEDRFRTLNIARSPDLSGLKWSVDHPEDLKFVRRVLECCKKRFPDQETLLELLREHPDLQRINLPDFAPSCLPDIGA